MQVRLDVKRRDIWAVAAFVHGVQHDLFFDADVLIVRKEAFVKERAMWFASEGRSHSRLEGGLQDRPAFWPLWPID